MARATGLAPISLATLAALAALAALARSHPITGTGPASSVTDPDPLEVMTPAGPVRGFELNNSRVWRGIPYAEPPVADLRFRPPQPKTPWGPAALMTDRFGASCMQMGSPQVGGHFGKTAAWSTLNLTDSSEDCLYLNVISPGPATALAESPAQPAPLLPVMVYLHAGEFRFGAANDRESAFPWFAAENPVVLVTGNARLGLLGFAALDQLRARDPSGSTGNYGMQDQRAILQWVRTSIRAFGGDPDRVTVFGESSGGSSVAFHLFSKQSAGLVPQAILESPGLTQSKPWADATANTQFAASALTAAGSPKCGWGNGPAAAAAKDGPFIHDSSAAAAAPSGAPWLELKHRLVSRHHVVPLGVADSVIEGQRLCTKHPDCLFVETAADGSIAVLAIGAAANQLSANQPDMDVVPAVAAYANVTTMLRLSDQSSDAIVNCLLGANMSDLIALDIAPPSDDNFQTDASAPTVDGVELSHPLASLARTPPPPGVSLLAGSNLDEGTEFMYLSPPISCTADAGDFSEWAVAQFGPALGAQIPAAYASVQQPTPVCPGASNTTDRFYMSAMRSVGDSAITCRTRDLLLNAQAGGSGAWWYQFTATPLASRNMDDLPENGAFHGAEVPFVFGDQFELSSDGERRLSAAMGCYWTNFASSGDPNENGGDLDGCAQKLNLPAWPRIGSDASAIQFSNTSIVAVTGLKQRQCDIFGKFP